MAKAGGQPPYGFAWEGGALVLSEPEATIRRRTFELFVEHRSKGAVARELNKEGFRTRRGKPWSDVNVRRLLECGSAAGRYPVNKTGKDASGKRVDVPRSKWEYFDCPRIVDEALWDEVQSILAGQKEPGQSATRSPGHPFAGLLSCGCGAAMRLENRAGKFVCPACKNKLPCSDLGRMFKAELVETVVPRLEAFAAGTVQASRPDSGAEEAPDTPAPGALGQVAGRWSSLRPSQQKRLVSQLVRGVLVRRDSVQFSYRIPDFSKEAPIDRQTAEPTSETAEPPLLRPGEPEYIRLPRGGERCRWTGLSRSALCDLIYAMKRNGFSPPVESIRSKDGGGRLIKWASLKAHLERVARGEK